ncbi:hypothetical protein [Bradyrhizobium sp. 33ap4]|uniref:hypothetical protein n=1 Tax=Bradyrhizobium sp. 33ap4 TaxID=3061630 RepID=UPI00292F393D|nr:hypothetical protein [Bradyrhizobium sp. 33ap4]
MNFLEQLDEVWRDSLEDDPETKKRKFGEFMDRLEPQVARLPAAQQAEALQPIMRQMAIYGSLQQNDPEGLKVRLGLSPPTTAGSADRLAQAAVETIDVTPQVDEFWREILGRDRKFIETRYTAFIKRMQDQVSHLPKAEQDALLWLVYAKSEEYTKLAELDRGALKVRLGLPPSSHATVQLASSRSTGRLAQVAAETVVRATIWESIAALFRVFR